MPSLHQRIGGMHKCESESEQVTWHQLPQAAAWPDHQPASMSLLTRALAVVAAAG